MLHHDTVSSNRQYPCLAVERRAFALHASAAAVGASLIVSLTVPQAYSTDMPERCAICRQR